VLIKKGQNNCVESDTGTYLKISDYSYK